MWVLPRERRPLRGRLPHTSPSQAEPRGKSLTVRSMTGYGRGMAERDGRRAEVEIRSVNHRFMDVKLRGAPLDAQVEERVSVRIR